MKKIILIWVMVLAGLTCQAQTGAMKFGFLSYDEVMKAMPEYATMQKNLAELRAHYEAEQQRVEDDFNRKYEEFLDGQASFPKTILQKRQSELQEMLEKNIAFKKESQHYDDTGYVGSGTWLCLYPQHRPKCCAFHQSCPW